MYQLSKICGNLQLSGFMITGTSDPMHILGAEPARLAAASLHPHQARPASCRCGKRLPSRKLSQKHRVPTEPIKICIETIREAT